MGGHSSSVFGEGWTLPFQRQVVAAVYRDPVFLASHHEVLAPEYFDSDVLGILVDIALSHFKVYTSPPPVFSIDQVVVDYCKKHSYDQDIRALLTQEAGKILAIDLSNINWVGDQVTEFGRIQAFRKVLEKGIAADQAARETGDTSLLQATFAEMSKVMTLGGGGMRGSLNLSDVLWDLQKINKAALKNKSRIPTGYKRIDEATGGGIGAGEVGIWAAPPGVGKSLILHNIAAYCIVNEIPVFISTHELKEIDVANRIASRITQVPISSIQTPKTEADERIYTEALERFFQGKDSKGLGRNLCEVKYYPPGTASISHLRSYLSQLNASKGFKPKLIIIDYADKLVPSVSGRVREALMSDTYLRCGHVMEEMAVLGDTFGAGTWTASQYNREGLKNTRQVGGIGDMHHLADSIRKGNDADILVTITQTIPQHHEGRAVAVITKDRRGRAGDIIDFDIDYARMTVKESANQVSQDTFYQSTPKPQGANR